MKPKILADAYAEQAEALRSVRDAHHRKQCSVCGQWKYRTSFHKGTRTKDGLKTFCKECVKAKARAK